MQKLNTGFFPPDPTWPACSQSSSRTSSMESVKNVSVSEAYELMTHGTPLLDVRTPTEHADGHPPSSLFNAWVLDSDSGRVPNASFIEDFMATFPIEKDPAVLLLCRSGARSTSAIVALQAKGYTKLLNITGGFMKWAEEGLPSEK